MPPLMHENFRYQNFFETTKGSPMSLFSTVGQKNSTENSDIPFLCIKFFDTQNFVKHRCSPTKFFGTEAKKFERILLAYNVEIRV